MDDKVEEFMRLVFDTIDVAISIVTQGGDLIPFFVTQDSSTPDFPTEIITLTGDNGEEMWDLARRTSSRLQENKATFAFAYAGFLTVDNVRNAAVIVEAKAPNSDNFFVFAQPFRPKTLFRPAKRIGELVHLANGPTLLRREDGQQQ